MNPEYFVFSFSFALQTQEWLRQWVYCHRDLITVCVSHKDEDGFPDIGCPVEGFFPPKGFSRNPFARLISGNANATERRMRRIVKRYSVRRPRVALFHFVDYAEQNSEMVLAALQNFDHVILHCHGADVTWDLSDYDGVQGRYHRLGYEEGVKRLESAGVRFFACTNYVKGKLEQIGIGEKSIIIKPIGVPAAATYNEHVNPGKAMGNNQDMCFVGRLIPCKGPDTALLAFAELVNNCPEYSGKLKIIGVGPYAEACKGMVIDLLLEDRVSFLGWLNHDQALEEIRISRFMLCGHRQDERTTQIESYGVSLVEAITLGTPIIGMQFGGPGEILEAVYPPGFYALPGENRFDDAHNLYQVIRRWLMLGFQDLHAIINHSQSVGLDLFSVERERWTLTHLDMESNNQQYLVSHLGVKL